MRRPTRGPCSDKALKDEIARCHPSCASTSRRPTHASSPRGPSTVQRTRRSYRLTSNRLKKTKCAVSSTRPVEFEPKRGLEVEVEVERKAESRREPGLELKGTEDVHAAMNSHADRGPSPPTMRRATLKSQATHRSHAEEPVVRTMNDQSSGRSNRMLAPRVRCHVRRKKPLSVFKKYGQSSAPMMSIWGTPGITSV